MMKSLRAFNLIGLLWLTAWSCAVSQQHEPSRGDYPSFERVVRKFCYQYRLWQGDGIPAFQRRPDGWYVAFNDYKKGLRQPALFWSLADQSFKSLNWTAADGRNDEPGINSYIRDNKYYFDHYLYAGYRQAHHDVIQTLQNLPALSDSGLYYLARAWSAAALDIINPARQNPNVTTQEGDSHSITILASAIDSFIRFTVQSEQTYARLVELNPGFQTVVGIVEFKQCNESMVGWLELSQLNLHERAKQFLQGRPYTGVIRESAENYLQSCPRDAILFTNGDNDTFPLLWLQQTQGMRTDVTIVNLSLLNTYRYIHYIRQLLPSGKVKMTQKEEYYWQLCKDGGYEIAEQPDTVSFPNPGKKINIPADEYEYKPEGEFKPRTGKYYLTQDIAVLDIIESNWGVRPVCFGANIPNSSLCGLQKHLWQRGTVNELLPVETVQNLRFTSQGINYDEYKKFLLTKEHHAEKMNAPQHLMRQGHHRIVTSTYLSGLVALLEYSTLFRKDEVKIWLDAMDELCQQLPVDIPYLSLYLAGSVLESSDTPELAEAWYSKSARASLAAADLMMKNPFSLMEDETEPGRMISILDQLKKKLSDPALMQEMFEASKKLKEWAEEN